ncbi:MAG TPA: ubiquitin-like protein Pup [Actinomycetota bacterium]
MASGSGGGAEQKRRATGKQDAEQEDVQASADVTEKGEALKDELDSLLDEIDDVLEENAEEFVKQYIQKGGQ